jgi:hypothetical protein
MFAVGLLFLTSCANGTPNVVAAIGLLPASFVFIIPYSEGAMFVSLAIGMGAAMRRWHVLSRVALFAAGMSRPAVIFFVAALMVVEWMRFSRDSWRHLALLALPVMLGYATTVGVMAVESGSWIGPFVAQKYWQSGQFSWTVRDWSYEGFLMTLPAVFMVWLPCAAWCLMRLFCKNVPHPSQANYWAWVSAFVVLFTAYAWYKNEGGLNGLSRYLTATPFFAVIALVVSQNCNRVSLPLRRIYVLVGFCLCLVFSAFSGYATPWNFAVLELILTCISIYLIVLPAPRSLIFWAFYVLPAVFWHAHIVNMLLRDAWIVT